MKYKALVKKIRNYGWFLKRQGSKHEIWTNGSIDEAVPRHREINERLAVKIIQVAKEAPRKDNL